LRRWQMRSSTRGLPDEYSQHPQGGTQYFSWKPKCAGRFLAKPGLAARRRKASSRIRTEARCRRASSGFDCRSRAESIAVLDLPAGPGSDFPLAKSATLPEVINRGFPVLSENTSTPVLPEADAAN